MNRKYNSIGAVVIKRKIYVLGGEDGGSWQGGCRLRGYYDKSVEVYDVDEGKYIYEVKKESLNLCSGTNLKILYLYIPITCINLIFKDKWDVVTNMQTERWAPGVAAHENRFYVTGGYHGQCSPSVDCYDPDTNTWSQVADMNMARFGHSLVCLNGRLFAIGGFRVDSVEVYDPDNDTWTLQQDKLDGRVLVGRAGLIRKEILIKK